MEIPVEYLACFIAITYHVNFIKENLINFMKEFIFPREVLPEKTTHSKLNKFLSHLVFYITK
jgi:hypothetical protein